MGGNSMKKCASCNHEVSDTAKICNLCGSTIKDTSISLSKNTCPHCQATISDSAHVCASCGKSISNNESPQLSVPSQPQEPVIIQDIDPSQNSFAENSTTTPPTETASSGSDGKGGVYVILLIIFLVAYFSGQQNVVSDSVKSGRLEGIGINMSLESFFNKAFDKAKWSNEKLRSGVYHVYVTGYSRDHDANLKVTFYCEELVNDRISYELMSISSLDTGVVVSNIYEMAGILEEMGAVLN